MSHSLTDLEAVAIGYVRSHQPCTPYVVRKCFQESPSTRFSDSAGSIYPMMQRLERRDLLRSEPQAGDRRQGRAYECTRAGLVAVRRWLSGPFEPGAVLTTDPLRTRMIYLALLTSAQRKAWFDDAERAIIGQLEHISSIAPNRADHSDVYWELADENARRLTSAQLDWLRFARERLCSGD